MQTGVGNIFCTNNINFNIFYFLLSFNTPGEKMPNVKTNRVNKNHEQKKHLTSSFVQVKKLTDM